MTACPPLATAQAIGLHEVEAATPYGSQVVALHPALLAHIQRAGVELVRRLDEPD